MGYNVSTFWEITGEAYTNGSPWYPLLLEIRESPTAPNVEFYRVNEANRLVIKASTAIRADEELFLPNKIYVFERERNDEKHRNLSQRLQFYLHKRLVESGDYMTLGQLRKDMEDRSLRYIRRVLRRMACCETKRRPRPYKRENLYCHVQARCSMNRQHAVHN